MRRLARHPSLIVVSGNNEASVFPNIPLYVGAELSTVVKENPNAVVYPSCPSWGWSQTEPELIPRPVDKKSNEAMCTEADGTVKPCPHDTHYYGPCGTIPKGTNMGTEFGWPSADLIHVLDKVTPPGKDKLRATTGASPFLDYRSQIKNSDWTEESMLLPNSTLVSLFPTLLDQLDNDRAGMARWL